MINVTPFVVIWWLFLNNGCQSTTYLSYHYKAHWFTDTIADHKIRCKIIKSRELIYQQAGHRDGSTVPSNLCHSWICKTRIIANSSITAMNCAFNRFHITVTHLLNDNGNEYNPVSAKWILAGRSWQTYKQMKAWEYKHNLTPAGTFGWMYLQVQHTCYFWALWIFPMFRGPLFLINVCLISAISLNEFQISPKALKSIK